MMRAIILTTITTEREQEKEINVDNAHTKA